MTAAFQFLTRIPIPLRITFTDEVFRRSVVFYPFVGLTIGVILAASGAGLQKVLPNAPAAVVFVLLWVFLTGALHLDGLMDTADGILSHRPRERMLEIMKDSRVGAMGVIVCVLYLLLKTALVMAWMELPPGSGLTGLLMLIPVWSRWFMVIAIAGWPYAREQGLGKYFRSVHWLHALASTGLALFFSVTAMMMFIADNLLGAMLQSLALVAVSGGFGWVYAALFQRKLGGQTGDTYGALNELLEVTLLLLLVWVTTI